MVSSIRSENFERLCQKPDHRRLGTWTARYFSRPVALWITWRIAPYGITANMATLLAWGCGLAAAGWLAGGTPSTWLVAALLLQLWYLLDHVDGQLARLRGTASVDGTQLDYLMHHTVNLLIPLGAGTGLQTVAGSRMGLFFGLAWAVGSLMIVLEHDARYKAFTTRLKRVDGCLEVVGGGGGRPLPPAPLPHAPLRLAAWLARKSCEMHVVMNALLLVSLASLLWPAAQEAYVVLMGLIAPTVAAFSLWRSQARGMAEAEFARWYRIPAGDDLRLEKGWWKVGRPATFRELGQARGLVGDGVKESY